jgi:hypothetical protein
MNGSRLSELRDSLLALYECARALGAHEVAYHALCGALHAAEELHDVETIALIGEHAQRHLGVITAERRPAFHQLCTLVEATKVRLKAERQLQQQKGRPQAPLDAARS